VIDDESRAAEVSGSRSPESAAPWSADAVEPMEGTSPPLTATDPATTGETLGSPGEPGDTASTELSDTPWWVRFIPTPAAVLALLFICSLLCRVVWLSLPSKSLIFDETYYVNAARIILGDHVAAGAPYAGDQVGHDPNREHPPLGKLLMAGSMRLLGDDAWGWRLPSLIAGMASILLIYAIVLAAGGDAWLGVWASALFAFDNLALVHSRIGTLDMMVLAGMLMGAWLYLRGQPLWAGVAIAVGALAKLPGVYALPALVLIEAVLAFWQWREGAGRPLDHLKNVGLLLLGAVPLWFVGLWLLDARFGYYRFPWEHLQYMLHYGFDLTRTGGPQGQESYPWQWLINDVQMTYFRADQEVMANGQVLSTRPTIYFRGAMNPIIIGAAPFGMSYVFWRAWRFHDRLSLWAAAWIIATFLPYFPLAMLEHRISYIYYFLPTLPAVTVGLAQFLRHEKIPSLVQWVFAIMVLVGFIGYFPFRTIP
jgi:dolichyl-phosphate-mannose-protein mannosyltransferase